MKVTIYDNISGAARAEGLTVIIDVFRAFSLEPYLISRGAGEILAVGAEETARRLKEENPDVVLIGERKGIRLPGFAYGNSPTQTEGAELSGKTVVHTTSAGTQGIASARLADRIITGSLVNAEAVAAFIRKQNPEKVSLVAMGLSGKTPTPEDTLCAEYLESLILQKEYDIDKELENLRLTDSAARFFDPEKAAVFPEGDYHRCTKVSIFDFVLEAHPIGEDIFRMVPVYGEMPAEEKVVQLMKEKGWHISFAESCTGGRAAARLVDAASASSVFNGSFVTYADEVKENLLGVNPALIKKYGVVSEQVARDMAEGCAEKMGAEIGVGITGIAGPTGGSEKKPVGTVCFGFRFPDGTTTFRKQFGNNGRSSIREASVNFVFETLLSLLEP